MPPFGPQFLFHMRLSLTSMILPCGQPAHNSFGGPFWAVRRYLFPTSTAVLLRLGTPPTRAYLFQAFLDAFLQAAAGGLIKYRALKAFRQAVHGAQSVLELVCVLVACSVTPLLHGTRGGIPELHGDRLGGS